LEETEAVGALLERVPVTVESPPKAALIVATDGVAAALVETETPCAPAAEETASAETLEIDPSTVVRISPAMLEVAVCVDAASVVPTPCAVETLVEHVDDAPAEVAATP
jgi:hypothetical protein